MHGSSSCAHANYQRHAAFNSRTTAQEPAEQCLRAAVDRGRSDHQQPKLPRNGLLAEVTFAEREHGRRIQRSSELSLQRLIANLVGHLGDTRP